MRKPLFLSFLTIIAVLAACSSEDNNETVNQLTECETAMAATIQAGITYDSATEENFVQACVAYKTALQNQKNTCGDANGDLQDIIDSLGDCSNPVAATAGTITVTAGSAPMVFDQVSVVKVGTTLKVTGETSAANDYSVYFEIEEGAEGNNIIQNFRIQLISAFQPMEGEFHSAVTTNETGTLDATFYGYVQNDDNATIDLTSGNIHLDY